MFLKNAASTQSSPPRNAHQPVSGTQTVIGPGVRIEGDLKSPSGVELHGTVKGSVELAGLLVIRESGQVVGPITAQEVIVDGAADGQIHASRRIALGSSARVQGDLQAKAVSIAEGAYFQGRVEMAEPSSQRSKEVPVPAEVAVLTPLSSGR